jgi:hypothetical protein
MRKLHLFAKIQRLAKGRSSLACSDDARGVGYGEECEPFPEIVWKVFVLWLGRFDGCFQVVLRVEYASTFLAEAPKLLWVVTSSAFDAV